MNHRKSTTDVWADIGGTFTDCLVNVRQHDGTWQQRTLKVLSSGLVAAELIAAETGRLTVAIPPAFVCEGFWKSAGVFSPDHVKLGTIESCELIQPADQQGRALVRIKLLQTFPSSLTPGVSLTLDGAIEAPVLATRLILGLPLTEPLPPLHVRLGTTRGTNALLTRGGAKTALLITKGFADLLAIGTQNRPELFALDIIKPKPLPETILEVPGRLAADGSELQPIDVGRVRDALTSLAKSPDRPEVIAICLMHAYQNDAHERQVETIVREAGFDRVVRSSQIAALPRIVPRAETTTLDAYLQPVLEDYVQRVEQQFGGESNCTLRWMTSGGNLVTSAAFRGRESVLSGPAGGVVALEQIARAIGVQGAVGLDMGGTSTDVSRYDGRIGRRQESEIAGIRVLSPMMDIHTVASGGGSICGVRDGRLFVGPESAGANPGPACYGRGGPLTITDLNVVLGRLPIDKFPFRLDLEASREALKNVHQQLPQDIATSPEELAEGFLKIAVTEMAEAARVVTTAAGNDVRKMTLVGFGGAAGGHLCRVAEALEMDHAVDHPQAGILSAVGIGNAPIGRILDRPCLHLLANRLQPNDAPEIELESARTIPGDVANKLATAGGDLLAECIERLKNEEQLSSDDTNEDRLETRVSVDVRYVGTQSPIELTLAPIESLADRMDQQHAATFGYARPTMSIETVTLRAEATVRSEARTFTLESVPDTSHRALQTEDSSLAPSPSYDRCSLREGETIDGPAIITSPHSILVVESGWTATVDARQWIQLRRHQTSTRDATNTPADNLESDNDAVEMEIIARRVQGIAEAMGEVIRRTSVSVNVKERRDYSCAVFLGDGSLVANAPHVPVHLGAMGHTVRSMIEAFPDMQPGDCFISNDPFAGGSHLPDITVVTPVFCGSAARSPGWPCDFFVASRCHHAEIGGMVPGSMAPMATCLADEGVVLRNLPLVYQGKSHHAAIEHRLSTARYPSRNVPENMADIAAAEAAGREGARAIEAMADSLSLPRLTSLLRRLLDVAGEATASWIESLGDQPKHFRDQLDDGTPVEVTLTPDPIQRRLRIDFTGTGPVHPHGFNATRSIVTAAVLYVLRCVTPNELPLCDGVLRRIDLVIPPGLLDPLGSSEVSRDRTPEECPAVVAGNVETSNRVVDVLLGTLGVAAASQGTMNNLLIGDQSFGYYETIGGGAGATASHGGADAVHTHMTNTRITDPEVLESRLPIRLRRFGVRQNSGGAGTHRGGDGMIRELEFLRSLTVSMITSRRRTSPYGIAGGDNGQPGKQFLIQDGIETELDSSFSIQVQSGDRLRIETPGGGGFGPPLS
ncbi:hydantoinase B/oxoprolinase family protein [Neorhodopirellula pilleata]|uniref:Acetophenone carboxylase gamma subunit n=1 Tax=Neorhodopirellula pilleata TaxID=2714738 RepID=A0A5C6A025_9BACT|nr:hydantoinase B/oxoprolinase family protein [Neorhodopirellula pilleata]TWT92548.1 Acetophenone carboxylase gamma subunit [Neorhodopirellula pilleata]